jgi:hypothetical protein
MDPNVEAEMIQKKNGTRKSRLLNWPKPYDATIVDFVNPKDGAHTLYTGGFGMGYYWEIRFQDGEYVWVDLDSCGGYEVSSYKTISWLEMAGYTHRIVGKYVARYVARQSRERSVTEE